MTSWQHGRLTIRSSTIHYIRTGGRKPPLLLVHGFTDSAACWTRLAGVLAPEFDIIMPDALGHGRSDRINGGLALTELAQHLIDVVHALELKQPLAVGHSMGAATIALAAAQEPDLFAAIALEDPPWRAAQPPTEKVLADGRLWYQWLSDLRQQPTAAAVSKTQAAQPLWAAIDVETYVSARQQFDLNLFPILDWQASQKWRQTIPQIRCPLLLLTADNALESIVTPAVAQEAISLARCGTHARIPAAGHHINRTQFDTYLAQLHPFLKAHANHTP